MSVPFEYVAIEFHDNNVTTDFPKITSQRAKRVTIVDATIVHNNNTNIYLNIPFQNSFHNNGIVFYPNTDNDTYTIDHEMLIGYNIEIPKQYSSSIKVLSSGSWITDAAIYIRCVFRIDY